MRVDRILLATVASLSVATSASAAVHVITYTGQTGTSSNDTVFGGATDISNLPFTLTFTYDPAKGHRTTTGTTDQALGGTNYGSDSPVLDAALTINGVLVDFAADQAGYIATGSAPGGVNDAISLDQYFGWTHAFRTLNISAVGGFPASLDDVFSGPVSGSGNFFFQDYEVNPLGGGHASATALGNLFPTQVQVSIPGAVPEPATWALLLTGFGLAGVALRRRTGKLAGA
jgi:hypothetical protein